MQDNKQAPGMLFAKFCSHISSTSNVIPLPARKKRETRATGTRAEAELAGRGGLRPVRRPAARTHETGFFCQQTLSFACSTKLPSWAGTPGLGRVDLTD